jgi:nitroreductase
MGRSHLTSPEAEAVERRRTVGRQQGDPVLCRRSIRAYTDDPVSHEMIHTLLQAAMAAHSAADERPWHFVVLRDPNIKDQVSLVCPFAHIAEQAPVAILVCGDLGLQKQQGFWPQDCAAATENILVEAQQLGLGAAWLGVYPVEGRVQGFRNLLGIPEVVTPFALVALGHPADWRDRLDQYDEVRVHYDCW